MHDFAITSRHIVLLLPPMIVAEGPADTLVDHYHWHADKPLIALVLDKETLTIQRRYELPARFLFHIGNAWEDEAGVIRLDACMHDDASFAVKTARDLALARASADLKARPTQVTLAGDGQASMNMLAGTGEFPRTDPRRVGLRHRFTYAVIDRGLARWDWKSGQGQTYSYGPGTWSEEPVFVPRPGSTDEADGWVVATVLNYAAARTELVVFDAHNISNGPVVTFACPYPLPLGFHGTFVPA
jgi:carotenoid cleavage dioxygenase-like enzyme